MTTTMQRRIYGHSTNVEIRPLNEEKAVQAAVDLFGELFVFTVWSNCNAVDILNVKETAPIAEFWVVVSVLPLHSKFKFCIHKFLVPGLIWVITFLFILSLAEILFPNCSVLCDRPCLLCLSHYTYLWGSCRWSDFCQWTGCRSCGNIWGAKKCEIRSKEGGKAQKRNGGNAR